MTLKEQETSPAERKLLQLTQAFLKNKAQLFYAPVSIQQAVSTADRPTKGPIWASRTTFPRPKDDAILTAVLKAIADLGGSSTAELRLPTSLADVKVQWSGYRAGAKKSDQEPEISEREKYKGLMEDTKSKTTIIYVHGGFYFTGGPASVRPVTSALARLSKGRCLVLDQRLSPRDPFPAPIIDLLVAYLSLLYPPPGSFHEAVPAEDIVLAGDSSGGNLCLAFLLLIRYFQERQPQIKFHNSSVSIPYPAGIATLGTHGDATSSLPSFLKNAKFDFLVETQPTLSDSFPACDLWPTSPPRAHIYTTTPFLTHPLVSPVASRSWPSRQPPPIFFAYGQERLLGEGRFIAQRAIAAGGTVHFHQYNALPHIFPFLFPDLPQSLHVISQWADFCRGCVEEPEKYSGMPSKYIVYEAVDGNSGFKGVKKEIVEKGEDVFSEGLNFEQVVEGMKKKQAGMKTWTGPTKVNMSVL